MAGGGGNDVWGRSREGRWLKVEVLAGGGGVGIWGRSKERRHCEGDRGREGVRREGELVGFGGDGKFGCQTCMMYPPPLSLSLFF